MQKKEGSSCDDPSPVAISSAAKSKSRDLSIPRPGGRFNRDDNDTTCQSLQSKTARYSLKPVNDSMRPPQVLLLSDSKPYSPKVNSMM